jgi:uncharacterized protein (TIGR01777 family)
MKVLLTGATGLIGKEAGKLLVKEGHEVLALTRNAADGVLELPFPAKLLEWKGPGHAFTDEVLSAFSGIEAVVNLMGENISAGRWNESMKKRIRVSRVDASRELIRAVLSRGSPRIWIQGSAVGYYGESRENEVFDEQSPRGSGFLAELCEEWEATLEALPASVRKVILRTGVVFSHKGGAFPKIVTPILNGVGGVLGNGHQMMSIIHLEDAARFVLHALQGEKVEGAYNLTVDQPVMQKILVQRLCVLLHAQPGPPAPAFALKVALGEMADLLLKSQAVVSRRIRESGFKFRYGTVHELLQEVSSWHQHPLKPHEATFVQFTEQFVPEELDRVFPFFSDARNLESITPDWLHFKIKSVSTESIGKGTKIRYRLKLHGLPIGWLTDIAEWDPPALFVDNQLQGPYSLWYHEHTFEKVPGGTLLRDWVRFRLPLGKVGAWVGLPKVRSDVERIFKHRKRAIHGRFFEKR